MGYVIKPLRDHFQNVKTIYSGGFCSNLMFFIFLFSEPP